MSRWCCCWKDCCCCWRASGCCCWPRAVVWMVCGCSRGWFFGLCCWLGLLLLVPSGGNWFWCCFASCCIWGRTPCWVWCREWPLLTFAYDRAHDIRSNSRPFCRGFLGNNGPLWWKILSTSYCLLVDNTFLIISYVIFTTIYAFDRMNISLTSLCGMLLTTSHTVMIQKIVLLYMVEILATMALYDFILFVG